MINKKNYSLLLGLLLIFVNPLQAEVLVIDKGDELVVQTEYGDYKVHEPVLVEIIRSSAFERLKHIEQYGVTVYRDAACGNKGISFSRYDHSLGVFVLLRHFGACLDEQVAGLLHDASHTVFSHVGDVVFGTYFSESSFQDDKLEWYLDKVGIMDILKKHHIGGCCSAVQKKQQKMLEQDKPDLCVDRIEYLLRGALADQLLTEAEVRAIVNDLCFEYPEWSFEHVAQAQKLGMISLWFSEYVFGAASDGYTYQHAAVALKRAVELNLITTDDICFSQDEIIWNILCSSHDDIIEKALDKVMHYVRYYSLSDESDYDQHVKVKCFAVNPWVQTEQGLQRLTAIDAEYAAEYKRVEALARKGWYLKFTR
ncbi:MAG: HD domain-containing protein [Candidatus Dependentiae bacterium]|nr:HD domain-containing protein [Candidatus Dependentiae bacterium]